MTQAIAKRESLSVTTARECNISDARRQLISDVFAKGATEDELSLFMLTAHRTGLDPAARQIFAVKRWDSGLKREVMSVQISIDGFRLIADRTNKYVPGKESTYTFDAKGSLESATAYIKKFVGGVWHEISATAFYTEYVQTTKDGNPNRMWQKMPRLMLAKTAESLVLRKAFPAELSGLYTKDEMGTDDAEIVVTPPNVAHFPAPVIEVVEAADNMELRGSPEAIALRQQLDELCTALNLSAVQTAKAIEKFNCFTELSEMEDMVAAARAKVESAERDELLTDIKTAITSEAWAYDETGTEKYLQKFGVDALDTATIESLRDLHGAMIEDGAIE